VDNLTHTLAGAALARAGLERSTRGASAVLLLAANLPDIDLVASLAGSVRHLEHHRGLSHSVVGAPLLALALAAVARAVFKGSRLLPLLACALAGVASHVFMDLWTSYGTRVLAPFDGRWFAWDLVYIVDPYVLATLALAVGWKRPAATAQRFASVGLGLVLAYVGARGVLHTQALEQTLVRVPARAEARRAVALPTPLDPFRWRALVDTGDAYWSGAIRLRGRTGPLARRAKVPEDAIVAEARRQSEAAAVFLDFSTFPWLEVERTAEGTQVVWRDLRFERPGRAAFVTRVVVGPDGRIKSQEFRF
jgi:inner membrane protein